MPYQSHGALKEPPRNQELWRYLDFPKFAALNQNQPLFFPSLVLFEDDPGQVQNLV